MCTSLPRGRTSAAVASIAAVAQKVIGVAVVVVDIVAVSPPSTFAIEATAAAAAAADRQPYRMGAASVGLQRPTTPLGSGSIT